MNFSLQLKPKWRGWHSNYFGFWPFTVPWDVMLYAAPDLNALEWLGLPWDSTSLDHRATAAARAAIITPSFAS